MDIKKIVEHICCDYTYGALLDRAKPYVKGLKRFDKPNPKRSDLEDVVYAITVLQLDPAGIYEIRVFDGIDTKCDGKLYRVSQILDYLKSRTIFNWYDEAEYPITKDQYHNKVIIKQVGTYGYCS